MSRTITSADSSFVLSSADFALAAVSLEGYGADASFATDDVDTAETVLSVDGKMSAGWIPRMYQQTITLQADSSSRDVFDALVLAQDAAKTVYRLNGVITLPGLGRSYVMSRGVLKRYSAMPNAQKTLKETTYQIQWESVKPVPIA